MAEHPTTVPDKKALPDQNFSTQPLNSGSLANPEAALPTQEWKVTAQTVARAAEAGIPIAREIITEAAEALGFGLVNILHTFSPEIVILGGGVMQIGALIMEPALKVVQEHTMRANMAKTRIVLAQLGINAGLVGAGALPAYYREQREGMAAHQGMGEDKA
jgi:predicted NBD/HSP70 family sugar kinase